MERLGGVPQQTTPIFREMKRVFPDTDITLLTADGDGSILNGSGADAVLWGVISGILLAAVMYKVQGIMEFREVTAFTIKGIQGLTPVVIVLALAFAISGTQQALGTGVWLAQVAQATVNPGFLPAIILKIRGIMP